MTDKCKALPWGVKNKKEAMEVLNNLPAGRVGDIFRNMANDNWRRAVIEAGAFCEDAYGVSG